MKRTAIFIVILLISSIYLQSFPLITSGLKYSHETSLTKADASFTGVKSTGTDDAWAGSSLANAGDINGDGYDDLLIGSDRYGIYSNDIDKGKVYLVFGKANGWTYGTSLADADVSFTGEPYQSGMAGISVANSCDVNGDGYDDIIIGAPIFQGANQGKTYLIYGKPSGWPKDMNLSDADTIFIGASSQDHNGFSVACAKDVNNDGYDDILSATDTGSAYLVFGKPTHFSKSYSLSQADVIFTGINGGWSYFGGTSVAGAGDVNGDNYDDILIGAYKDDSNGPGTGQTFLFFGKSTGWLKDTPVTQADASFRGPSNYVFSGCSVSGAGDVNGDGYGDILIGAPGTGAGQSFLIFGKKTGWIKNMSLSNSDASFFGEYISDFFGSVVVGAGDVNGDGFGDILIGAANNTSKKGQSYLFLGKPSNWNMNTIASTADASFIGNYINDFAGQALSGGGDVNGDGLDDIMIGAPRVSNGQGIGVAYLLFPDHNAALYSIDSIKAYGDNNYLNQIISAGTNDNVFIELQGLDGNASKADVALVNVSSKSSPMGFHLKLHETASGSHKYHGNFTISDKTNEDRRLIEAYSGENVTITSLDDGTKTTSIYIGYLTLWPKFEKNVTLEDEEYLINYTVVGNAISEWKVKTNATWLSWDTIKHRLSGTPNNSAIGTQWVNVSIKDSLGHSDVHNFTIQILNTPPEILTKDTSTILQDQYYYIDYNSSDDGQGNIIWHLKTNASWLEFNRTTGILNGTPTNFEVGNYWVNISVDDGNGGWNWSNFSLNVINLNDPPILLTKDVLNATQGLLYSVSYEAIDIDVGDQVAQWYCISNTSWLSFDNTTHLLYGTPNNDDIGEYWVNVSAEDLYGGIGFHNFTLTVKNVNDPPVIESSPVTEATVLFPYEYQVMGKDIDVKDTLNYSLENSPKNMVINPVTGHIHWMPSKDQRGINPVIIIVSDGTLSVRQTFNITVTVPQPSLLLPKNNSKVTSFRPELSWLFQYSSNKNVSYEIYLDNYKYPKTLVATVSNRTNYTVKSPLTDNKVYYWKVLPKNGDAVADFSPVWSFQMNLTLVLRLDLDRNSISALRGEKTIINMTISNDGDLEGIVNIILKSDLNKSMFQYLTNISLASGKSKTTPLTIIIPNDMKLGTYEIQITARLNDAMTTKSLTLSIIKKPQPVTNFWENPWFWIIVAVIGIISALGMGYLAISRRRTKAELDATKLEAEAVEDFEIDEVFLIYQDGRLISHVGRKESGLDDQIFGGMLIAVQSFVKDSFQEEGGLKSFEFGSRKMLLEKGDRFFLVVALSGVEPPNLRPQMQELNQKLEGIYAGIIEEWDGNIDSFKDVDKSLTALFGIKEGLKIKKEKEEVKVRSGVEFFSGFVRLKVAIRNELTTAINNVELRIGFDDKVLRLDHIEPDYSIKDHMISLGTVERDEKRTVAFYLDPLICQDSHISGSVEYVDTFGNEGKVEMKARPVDIVCPIFYTKETINVAMLKKLLDELQFKDSKIYKVRFISTLERIYNLSNTVAKAHDIKFVREYKNTTPFEAESWYYGEVKETHEKIVIRVAARESKEYLELFIASSNLATLTGLLAELAGQLNARIRTVDGLKDAIIPTTDEWLKDEVEQTDLLLNKMVSMKKIHKYVVVQKENPRE